MTLSSPFTSGCWTPGGQGLLRALPRSYQVTPDIPDRRRATQQKEVRPDSGRQPQKRVSSPPGRDLLLSVGRHRPAESKQQASTEQSRSGVARMPVSPRAATVGAKLSSASTTGSDENLAPRNVLEARVRPSDVER